MREAVVLVSRISAAPAVANSVNEDGSGTCTGGPDRDELISPLVGNASGVGPANACADGAPPVPRPTPSPPPTPRAVQTAAIFACATIFGAI